MIDVLGFLLEFLRTDIFTSFGLLTIPFLIGRQIPKLKENFFKIDESACRFIIFAGLVYTGIILLYWAYLFLFMGDSNPVYEITSSATGSYAWTYWVFPFSWLFITQPFRFKLVRKCVDKRTAKINLIILQIKNFNFERP